MKEKTLIAELEDLGLSLDAKGQSQVEILISLLRTDLLGSSLFIERISAGGRTFQLSIDEGDSKELVIKKIQLLIEAIRQTLFRKKKVAEFKGIDYELDIGQLSESCARAIDDMRPDEFAEAGRQISLLEALMHGEIQAFSTILKDHHRAFFNRFFLHPNEEEHQVMKSLGRIAVDGLNQQDRPYGKYIFSPKGILLECGPFFEIAKKRRGRAVNVKQLRAVLHPFLFHLAWINAVRFPARIHRLEERLCNLEQIEEGNRALDLLLVEHIMERDPEVKRATEHGWAIQIKISETLAKAHLETGEGVVLKSGLES